MLGQFGFIAAGTFHFYCWDIMEPICYLMTFGNFTAGYFFYLTMKSDLELNSLHEILTERMTRRACARKGISLEEIEERKQELKRLQDELALAHSIL